MFDMLLIFEQFGINFGANTGEVLELWSVGHQLGANFGVPKSKKNMLETLSLLEVLKRSKRWEPHREQRREQHSDFNIIAYNLNIQFTEHFDILQDNLILQRFDTMHRDLISSNTKQATARHGKVRLGKVR